MRSPCLDIEKTILNGDTKTLEKQFNELVGKFGKDKIPDSQIAYWFWLSVLDNQPNARFQAPRSIVTRTDNNTCFYFLLKQFPKKAITAKLQGSVNLASDCNGTIYSNHFKKLESGENGLPGKKFCFKISNSILKVWQGSSALHFAAQENNPLALKAIAETANTEGLDLQPFFDPEKSSHNYLEPALSLAIMNHCWPCVAYLLAIGANPLATQQAQGKYTAVSRFFTRSVDVNDRPIEKDILIHWELLGLAANPQRAQAAAVLLGMLDPNELETIKNSISGWYETQINDASKRKEPSAKLEMQSQLLEQLESDPALFIVIALIFRLGYVLETKALLEPRLKYIAEKWMTENQTQTGKSEEYKIESLVPLQKQTKKNVAQHLRDMGLTLSDLQIDTVIEALLNDKEFDINRSQFPITREAAPGRHKKDSKVL
ncbi:MAG: hypothetical protein K0U12_02575, partial [Gammaproteobacteria bacterium]|nr:hypothetical protein [Gammaproteobacteria bacterium]